jgi:hypothetical protein
MIKGAIKIGQREAMVGDCIDGDDEEIRLPRQ